MKLLHYQFQEGGMWRECGTVEEGASQHEIYIELNNLTMRFPGYRIRCVDDDGRVVDFRG